MAWKTYLVMYFTGERKITEVVEKVESLGFKSALGPADFLYDWGENEPTKQQVFELADQLSILLKGMGAVFNLETHN